MSFDPRVSARHADIPQPTLFDVEATTRTEVRRRTVKPAGHGQCPTCQAPKVAQLLVAGERVWKAHMRRTIRGAGLPCSAGGTVVEQ